LSVFFDNIVNEIDRLPDYLMYGQVSAVVGLLVEVDGVQGSLSIGDNCRIVGRRDKKILCEVIGFRDGKALVMPFGTLDGIGLGCPVEVSSSDPVIYPDERWLGRVINAFGEPIDDKGPLPMGGAGYPIHRQAPPAHTRQRIGGKLDLGIRSLNTFLTCCHGQRMGIFAGSGVGKSTVLSMMARNTDAAVNVIGLIGERGREAREFIEDDLGEEGLARSIVIIATSDEPPLVRRQAAFVTMAVAEYFRDQGQEVLCLMDSITRFAMAQREISLSAGEPPASKGYTPSVFAQLPQLLERAGPGAAGQGTITGLFTVLVEGDDHNEPVADAVRGILDGHIVLSREIAERGRYPAVDILKSVSRTMPDCNTDNENAIVDRARRFISVYEDMAELIRLGAYRHGSDASIDESIHFYPAIEEFLSQKKVDKTDLATCYQTMGEILGAVIEEPAPAPTQAQAQVQAQAEQPAQPQPQPQPQPAAAEPAAAPPVTSPSLVADPVATGNGQ
jgi:flagellum-specific ATP synthase